jgi:hypothetical protein
MRAPPTRKNRLLAMAAGLGLLLAVAADAQAQALAGEVEFSRGVGFAQSPGQTARTLGQGLPLREGDRLTTAEGASAIIKLNDGTRMTVRPNSEIVLTQYQFRENAADNGMLMSLVRGGFRAVTGLISKGSPNAARVQTNTATIGIRGTDFDARVCRGDCATESQRIADAARPNAVLASAKIVQAQGQITATGPNGERRQLVDGGGVYPGDLIETGERSSAVLAFRDESRVSLGARTRFRVDNFVYDEKNAGEGRFLASILRGSVRALTGLIARTNNRNVGFSTATATIGIRGTGFDASCDDSGTCNLWTWLGSITVTPQGQTALQVLQAGQGLFISPTQILPISNQPPIDGTRPDGVTVPPGLFSYGGVTDADDGLFVYVRDGQLVVEQAGVLLHLGRGEAGHAGDRGVGRPTFIPKFIDFDKLPSPTSRNPLLVSVLSESGIQQRSQCK